MQQVNDALPKIIFLIFKILLFSVTVPLPVFRDRDSAFDMAEAGYANVSEAGDCRTTTLVIFLKSDFFMSELSGRKSFLICLSVDMTLFYYCHCNPVKRKSWKKMNAYVYSLHFTFQDLCTYR